MNRELTLTREKAVSGADREYFEELVRRHYRQAYNVAYRLSGSHADADDLTQEALIRAFESLHRYQRDLPFINWLYRIMVNLHIDEVRRRRLHVLVHARLFELGQHVGDVLEADQQVVDDLGVELAGDARDLTGRHLGAHDQW